MKSVALTHLLQYDLSARGLHKDQSLSIMSDIKSGRIPQNEVADIPIKYLDLTDLPGVPEQNIMTPSTAYKPHRYEFGFIAHQHQNKLHWMHDEIQLGEDVKDWKTKLTGSERNLLTKIFPLFVQNDFLVQNVYMHEYARLFKPNELQLAFSALANMESIHQISYAYLLDEVGFNDDQYSEFLKYKEMIDKYNFTAGYRPDTLMGIAVALVVFGALTEGVQLFASFLTLFNFTRFNKMKGMGQIVTLSVRDESFHVAFVAEIFKTFMKEFGHLIDVVKLWEAIEFATHGIVKGEHLFADLAFEQGPVEGMDAAGLKQYICSIADMRLSQFGLQKIFNVENPYDWSNSLVSGVEFVNFFEQRSTSYSKAATRGSWFDAWARRDQRRLTKIES